MRRSDGDGAQSSQRRSDGGGAVSSGEQRPADPERPAEQGRPGDPERPADQWRPAGPVDAGDVQLAVYEQGEPAAETVLLVHGYPDTHTVWNGVAERLAQRFHVVAYDVRGAGESSAPAVRAGYRLDRLAADLFAVADATSPQAPVHLVGHDWGSIQAWEAVTEAGAERRIASFTSISGPCLDHVGHLLRARLRRGELARVAAQLARSYYIAVFQLPLLAPAVWRLGLARWWARLLARFERVPPGTGHPQATLRCDAVRGLELYRANMGRRLWRAPRERRTQVPVQLVVLSADRFVGALLTEDVERWAPRLHRVRLPARHWVPLTHPAELAEFVSEFARSASG